MITLSLSLNFMSSENVIMMAAIKTWISFSLVRDRMMIDVVKKKANDPSSDFENNFVFPNFIPIIAAIESERLKIKREIMAILALKIKTVNIIPVNTHVAPVGD